MSLEDYLIMSIKCYCLSESYLDGCNESYCDGLDVAKTIILEKINQYEIERDKLLNQED